MNENISCKRLGNLNGHTGGNYAGQVFDVEGIAPTIRTPTGGGLEPMIIEEESQCLTPKRTEYGKAIRKDYESHKISESRHNMTKLEPRTDGICNTISTVQKDYLIVEPQSCAVRGRYTGENGETEQHLELGDSDVANCLTSVAKDSMVLETEQEYVGVKQATKSGVIACEIGGVADLSYPDSQFRRGRVQDQGRVSPTLTGSPGICRIEKNEMNDDAKIIKVGQICNEGFEHGTVVSEEGLFPSLVAGTHGYANPHVYHRYRIRKITEREAYRLMDFSDEDFEKGRAVSSKTQMYKTAGNSIICNVLVALFGQMFEGREDKYKEIKK